jgi:hypothetical protein
MPGRKLVREEEESIVPEQRRGLVLMTAGKVLLWMDLLLLAFVYIGLRGGSHLWMWWVIGEAVLGSVLLGIGAHRRGSLSRIPR